MMKKTICVLLAMALLCASCALGQERAAVKWETLLLAAPNKSAKALMSYSVGTRVEVIRDTGNGYVQVNVGVKGGSLMGYMKKDDLVFGEEAIRALRAVVVDLSVGGGTCHFYSYPDEESVVIDDAFYLGSETVIGRLGDWLHVKNSYGQTGFVSLREVELLDETCRDAYSVEVEPARDELSVDAAIEAAKTRLLADRETGANLNLGMDDLSAEGLAQCEANVRILYRHDYPEELLYEITFIRPDRLGAYAYINLVVRGSEIVEHNYGNG